MCLGLLQTSEKNSKEETWSKCVEHSYRPPFAIVSDSGNLQFSRWKARFEAQICCTPHGSAIFMGLIWKDNYNSIKIDQKKKKSDFMLKSDLKEEWKALLSFNNMDVLFLFVQMKRIKFGLGDLFKIKYLK